MNKAASVALAIIAVILALLILAIYLVGVASRECSNNKDCPDNAYCGTDYECHQFPDQVLVRDNNLILAATIIGVALIIAAYLFRRKMPAENRN